MKKLFYWLLALALILSVFPATAWALADEVSDQDGEAAVVHQETVLLPDGSVLESRVVEYPSRAGYYKDGSHVFTCRNSSGVTLWEATLTATFYYNGSISSCTTASLSIHFNNNNFFKVSENVSWSGNTATANFTIGQKFLGVTIGQTAYTLTLSCDKNGHMTGSSS